MRKVRENILVTKGNYAIFAAGRNVFSDPDPIYGGPTIVPVDGQLVVYDNHSGVSLDQASVLGRPNISVATAHDTDGDGMANYLRKAFGDKIWGDYVSAFTAEPSRCAINEVVDVLFSCTHCNEPYTVTVVIEDNETQNQFPQYRHEEIPITVSETCCSCADCPEDSDTACQIAQRFVDEINGVTNTNPLKSPTFSRRRIKPPVTAVRLFGGSGASKQYCFDPVVTDGCTNCVAIDLIYSFKYDIGDGEVEHVFTGNVDPSDAGQTLIAQMKNIVRQINIALDGRGSAILTRGVGKCCPITLEINSCADVTLQSANDVDIVPCASINPLSPIETGETCLNCSGDPAPTTTFEYGFRVFADDVEIPDTTCFPPNPVKGNLVRKVDIYPSGGFSCGGTYVRKVQKAQHPEGLGYQWQWRDYASATGGSGREHQPFNKNYGPLRLPGNESRAKATLVNPNTEYCSYVIEHGLPHTNTGVSDAFRVARGRTVILVPSADTVTQASVELVLGSYISSANNPVTQSAICGTDQDQVQNSGTEPNLVEGYRDANGMIY